MTSCARCSSASSGWVWSACGRHRRSRALPGDAPPGPRVTSSRLHERNLLQMGSGAFGPSGAWGGAPRCTPPNVERASASSGWVWFACGRQCRSRAPPGDAAPGPRVTPSRLHEVQSQYSVALAVPLAVAFAAALAAVFNALRAAGGLLPWAAFPPVSPGSHCVDPGVVPSAHNPHARAGLLRGRCGTALDPGASTRGCAAGPAQAGAGGWTRLAVP